MRSVNALPRYVTRAYINFPYIPAIFSNSSLEMHEATHAKYILHREYK